MVEPIMLQTGFLDLHGAKALSETDRTLHSALCPLLNLAHRRTLYNNAFLQDRITAIQNSRMKTDRDPWFKACMRKIAVLPDHRKAQHLIRLATNAVNFLQCAKMFQKMMVQVGTVPSFQLALPLERWLQKMHDHTSGTSSWGESARLLTPLETALSATKKLDCKSRKKFLVMIRIIHTKLLKNYSDPNNHKVLPANKEADMARFEDVRKQIGVAFAMLLQELERESLQVH